MHQLVPNVLRTCNFLLLLNFNETFIVHALDAVFTPFIKREMREKSNRRAEFLPQASRLKKRLGLLPLMLEGPGCGWEVEGPKLPGGKC